MSPVRELCEAFMASSLFLSQDKQETITMNDVAMLTPQSTPKKETLTDSVGSKAFKIKTLSSKAFEDKDLSCKGKRFHPYT